MDNFNISDQISDLPENSIDIFNGLIEDIRFDNDTAFITVSYEECLRCERTEQTVVMVASNRTLILNERGNEVPVTSLTTGMIVNAAISSAITRSLPPQAAAFVIRIVRRPASENITIGRIIDIDRQNRTLTTISDGNLSSIIIFHVPVNTLILDFTGRRIDFSRLMPGIRVRIRHASFMTASIPPQTTAFEIRVIR